MGGFEEMWAQLAPIGRDERTGGYRRYSYNEADMACREWFVKAAQARGLDVETDGNGNLWAWWHTVSSAADGGEREPGVVTGSHLDSVPDGGAFDGPLGIVSAFAAIDKLREIGATPRKPIGVVAFAEEEGARFGVACLGSRLLTGAYNASRARALTDANGVTLADAMSAVGRDPMQLGQDDELVRRIGMYLELHIEQGRGLVDLDTPVGVATGIWPHGRWRLDITGEANHAGTTRLDDRHDPMLTFANTVLAVRKKAKLAGALATIGRVACEPNGTNAVPSKVSAWLDVRAPDEATLEPLLIGIEESVMERADRDGTAVTLTRESYSPEVTFDEQLRKRLATVLASGFKPAPQLGTGAGHDAGILSAAGIPSAMLFVRNTTGVSHSPAEHADPADCAAGVTALAAVLAELAC